MRKSSLFISIFFLGAFLVLAKGSKATFAAPHLTLTPSTGTYNVNDTFTATVGVDSDTEGSNAVDVWATFDATKLDVVSIVKAAVPAFNFDMTPHFDNTTGKFDFSCSPSDMSNLSIKPIKGDLAVITFKAKVAGNAPVNFTCQQGVTIDSNIFNATASDVISCPANQSGSFTIGAATTTTGTTNAPAATTTTTIAATTATSSELPKTGSLSTTIGLATFGLVSVLGAFLLRFL